MPVKSPIKSPTPPPAALDALRSGLGQMRGLAGAPAAAVASLAAETAAAPDTLPHETYHLGLDAIQAKRGVAAAEPVGWRYILGRADQPNALAAEVHSGDDGFVFAGVNEGPFNQHLTDTLRRIESQIPGGDYEPRLLRIPALYIAAVWLKSQSPAQSDLYVPLEPSNPEVTPGRIYAAKEFEAALEKAAHSMTNAAPPATHDSPHAP
jgi:hypothetical protein